MSTRTPSGAQVAINPLTWMFTEAGFDPSAAPPLPEIYRQIKQAGFDAVHVDIPQVGDIGTYRTLLDDSGLAPAPGYFQTSLSDTTVTLQNLDAARELAARHAELGLDRIFVADQFAAQPRAATPARGVDADGQRLDLVIDNLRTIAEAMVAEGVHPCLHQHVGTWIETEAETEAVLAAIEPALLLFGPDTGHLSWAGMDAPAIVARHLDRVGAVHLKDFRRSVSETAHVEGLDYMGTNGRHVFTEPGRGDVDLTAVLEVLARFDGWYVVEVDLADQPTPQDTARVSADWVRSTMFVADTPEVDGSRT